MSLFNKWKKKTIKVPINCFFQLTQWAFWKNWKIPYSDIHKDQNFYNYNTGLTNSCCLVKRSQINPLAILLFEIIEIVVDRSIYLSIYLSINLSIYQSIYLHSCCCFYIYIHRSIYLSIYNHNKIVIFSDWTLKVWKRSKYTPLWK